jgi:hypothetical protein
MDVKMSKWPEPYLNKCLNHQLYVQHTIQLMLKTDKLMHSIFPKPVHPWSLIITIELAHIVNFTEARTHPI